MTIPALTAILLVAGLQAAPVGVPAPAVNAVRVFSSTTPDLVQPVPLKVTNAQYPAEAARARISGDVELEITVGTDGRVRDVMIKKSLETVYGLDEKAIAAAAEWTFQPGTLHGQAVPVGTTASATFRLR